jgi:hypothetical protein
LLALAGSGPLAPRFAALLTKQVDSTDATQPRQLPDAKLASYNGVGLSQAELPEADRELADALEGEGIVSRTETVRSSLSLRVMP